MKATEAKLLAFLKPPKQFLIPIYQRTYSWTLKQCQQFWSDILRVAQDSKRTGHFVGSIVYVERGIHNQVEVPQLLVIDGQQRLTTLTLLLAALRKHLPDGDGADVSGRKVSNYYLVNNEESGDLRSKLVLTQNDRDTLFRVIDGGPLPAEPSRRIIENHRFFEAEVAKAMKQGVAPEVIYAGITKLLVVDIALDRTHDNAQLIFESLNSTGLALSQADLIRNYVLMGLEPALQTTLYQQYWYPMEQRFGASADTGLFDRFMRDFLTVKMGQIPNIRDVYEAFKMYAGSEPNQDVRALVADIAAYAEYFARMAIADEPESVLRSRFLDINALKVDVAFPLLLEVYADYARGLCSRDEFARMLDLVESYVLRRAICGIPTNSLNKTFAEFSDHIVKEPGRYLESFTARFALLESYRRFPTDEDFVRHFVERDVYTLTSRRHYLLRKLENYGRKEPVAVEQYTIEHILPQNPNLSPEWRAMLGSQWAEVQGRYLHTIGNLTLTGYNPELSDRSFLEKRNIVGGFADSPLRLNQDLRKLEAWTEEEIRARGERLATLAVKVWPAAVLPAAVLDAYRPTRTRADVTTGVKLEDHRWLAGGPLRDLFDEFRDRCFALGPDVNMYPLKTYVAFKSTTNFVDVIPQSKRLWLTLNMEFPELDDPAGVAEDVTGLGMWGNGDIRVPLESSDQLDYVMGLVRQAYERQALATMGD